jgi:lipopolysaccharide transport system permease protein
LTHLSEAHWRLRRVLYASAKVELQKRYAGSMLGPVWTVLYPLLFLSVYVFLWLVVLRVRFPGETSRLGYVVFVFGGLVPYLFAVESVTTAAVSIRQNMHLVKGLIIPVELIPTRAVAVALAGHLVGVTMAVVLCAANGDLSSRVVLLPAVIVLQAMGLAGVCWIVASIGVLVPDTAYVINLIATLLMFVSPIAFKPEMVPARMRAIVWLNPVTYMAGAYRSVLMRDADGGLAPLVIFALMALAAFALGATFCWRFKNTVVDFE